MKYALGNLLRNLLAGLRVALLMPVDRLRFRIDVVQVLLLFVVSAIIDLVGDYYRSVPPRSFAIEGLGSEIYSGGLLVLASAIVAVLVRQRQLVLSIPLVVLASLPFVQILHYVPSWLALGPDEAELVLAFEYVMVTWIVVILVRSVAIAFAPPPSFVWLRAILAGLLLAMPIWLGNTLFVNQPWFRGVTDEAPAGGGEFSAGSEAVLAAQKYILDNALDVLADERSGETDLYFVGFAPHGRSDAFREDAEAAQQAMVTRWGADGRSIVLVNSPKTLITAPFATITNLRETLNEIGGAIDPEDDVVMVYITAPTARNNQVAAEQPPLALVELGPAGLKQLMDDAGIKWRIVVVSACYSGGFADTLADDYTLVITSTKADTPGLGCDGRTPPTLFGDAFFQQGLAKVNSFEAAFEIAKAKVAERERAAGYEPASDPQWRLGDEMAQKLKNLRKRGGSGATVLRASAPSAG
ncbi:MAG: C13 family peptidase [Burkholderiales bacterium]